MDELPEPLLWTWNSLSSDKTLTTDYTDYTDETRRRQGFCGQENEFFIRFYPCNPWFKKRVSVPDGVFMADFAVDFAEGLHFAREALIAEIDVEQAEFFGVAELPLEVVEQ